MTDSQRHRQNGIGSRDCPRIGIDSTGAHHFLDEPNGRVLVARDGDVVDTHDLAGRPLDEYRQYVADDPDEGGLGREWREWLRGQLAAEIAAVGGGNMTRQRRRVIERPVTGDPRRIDYEPADGDYYRRVEYHLVDGGWRFAGEELVREVAIDAP